MYLKTKPILLLTILPVLAALLIFSGCGKTRQMSSGGYSYEVVKGDPLKARIYTLDNGLKVYMTVYKDEPRIQTAVAVRVGSKNDPDENTGLAHYFEHLMFKGTDEFGTQNWEKEKAELEKIVDLFEDYRSKTDPEERAAIYKKIDSVSAIAAQYAIANEYDKMLSAIGATGTNAFTSFEQTVYINDIPSNQLDKWLKIESERFKDPVLRLFHTELEVVYEEKNMSLDRDNSKAFWAMMDGLFDKHQYGRSVLGSVEHLKNPSMQAVMDYFDTWYVPNNIAICMSGDFDPDEVIKKIDETFGQLEAKELPEYNPPAEEPIEGPVVKEVIGPDMESVMLAFRLPGGGTEEADLLSMTDMILSNSQAGLIDLNLNQKQKVLGAYCRPGIMKDYSYHTFGGRPRGGQSLEEVKDLLLEQIELVKQGEFPEWLLQAIINDFKLNRIRSYERNRSRAFAMVQAFVMDQPWEREVNRFERLAEISKADIIEFAKKHYSDNYVVVYKRTGTDTSVVKIKKPQITEVKLNRTDQSDFLKSVLAMEAEDVQPVFLDFEKDINQFAAKNNIPVLAKVNDENDLFELYYITDMGTDHNKKLGVALNYLEYLGTSKYTPEQIKEEFYKIGCSFRVNSSNDRIWVSLTGLQENFVAGVQLFEHLLADVQPNPEALDNLIKDILKNRADAKLNKNTILFGAMSNYAKYGPKSSFTHILSEEELNNLKPQELIDIINGLNKYEHRILYYGPSDEADLVEKINAHHQVPEQLEAIPEPEEFVELPTRRNKVYVVDYDMRQAQILMLSKSVPFNPDNLAERALFNEYYGGNMSSVVFQTMREAKALAYSVYGNYQTPSKKEDAHYMLAYIATQADKLGQALDGFNELLNEMPESQASFDQSKEAIIKRIAPERITKSDILFRYERAKRLGLDYDTRKVLWKEIPDMTLEDIKSFFEKYVKGQKYNIMILGDKDELDKRVLRRYGDVTYLSMEEIFGY